jgi:glucose/arabinose dehydrogenase
MENKNRLVQGHFLLIHSLLIAIIMAAHGISAAAAQLKSVRVTGGLAQPLFLCAPPGDQNRLFIVEQNTGRIRIFDRPSNRVLTTPFLTVSGLTTTGERGLLGLAFHPDYAANGFFYVNYTGTGGRTEIARFKVRDDPATSNTADPASRTVLLTYNQPESNHNGGWLGFGLDGYLYISSGDGGGGNDRHGAIGNGQDRTSLLGKILRIDVNSGALYGIPDGNPFKGHLTFRNEIWAFGLRNPWRCSIDRQTGDLWIGDVGQSAREEIDFNPAGVGGLNFGWRPREGFIQNPAYDGSPYPLENPLTTATNPVHDYGRGLGVSVTGGYMYRGAAMPSLRGTYFFADYGSARIWSFTFNGTSIANLQERTAELNSNPVRIGNISSFGEDAEGEIYICDYADGEIYKIVSAFTAPTITQPRIFEQDFLFEFATQAGQPYTVEFSETLPPGNWQVVTNIPAGTVNGTAQISTPLTGTQRFFRVITP